MAVTMTGTMTREWRNGNDMAMPMRAIGRIAEVMDSHNNSDNDGDGEAWWQQQQQ